MTRFVDASLYPTIACIEPKGLFGVPDLVIANFEESKNQFKIIRTYAFELKLYDWRRALIQAYKYQAFSNYSFVLLDEEFIQRALNHLDLFVLSNIGLISLHQSGNFLVHHFPDSNDPYSENLKQKLSRFMTYDEKLYSKFQLDLFSNNTGLTLL